MAQFQFQNGIAVHQSQVGHLTLLVHGRAIVRQSHHLPNERIGQTAVSRLFNQVQGFRKGHGRLEVFFGLEQGLATLVNFLDFGMERQLFGRPLGRRITARLGPGLGLFGRGHRHIGRLGRLFLSRTSGATGRFGGKLAQLAILFLRPPLLIVSQASLILQLGIIDRRCCQCRHNAQRQRLRKLTPTTPTGPMRIKITTHTFRGSSFND
mmetsp:Transcript_9809/g.17843  ORF Transcript_9809/g.17843 Transcript_9809/m.17843 type:complete len:209 (+) Transcript_9809:63-689(+)